MLTARHLLKQLIGERQRDATQRALHKVDFTSELTMQQVRIGDDFNVLERERENNINAKQVHINCKHKTQRRRAWQVLSVRYIPGLSG